MQVLFLEKTDGLGQSYLEIQNISKVTMKTVLTAKEDCLFAATRKWQFWRRLMNLGLLFPNTKITFPYLMYLCSFGGQQDSQVSTHDALISCLGFPTLLSPAALGEREKEAETWVLHFGCAAEGNKCPQIKANQSQTPKGQLQEGFWEAPTGSAKHIGEKRT